MSSSFFGGRGSGPVGVGAPSLVRANSSDLLAAQCGVGCGGGRVPGKLGVGFSGVTVWG